MIAVALNEYLTSQETSAVEEFVRQLYHEYDQHIEQTIFFGSKARGDSRPDSDIDILIIVDEENWTLRNTVSDIASDVSLEYGVLLNPRIIGKRRWERMARHRFGLYENIEREGILLARETVS